MFTVVRNFVVFQIQFLKINDIMVDVVPIKSV